MKALLPTKKNITVVANYLKQGAVVMAPTETAYGLLADATNNLAVKKIFEIKGRRLNKAVALVVADWNMAKQYGIFTKVAEKLAKQYWPGPLTVVIPAKKYGLKKLAPQVLYKKTVGMRVPRHHWLRQVIRKVNRPLTATSANLADKKNSYSFKLAKAQLKKRQVDYFVNGQNLPQRPVSTIVKAVGSKVIILRSGGIKI